MADTIISYIWPDESWNNTGGFFHDVASDPTGYTFTITSASATAGDTYTNNGNTFTVLTSISSQTTLSMSGTGPPEASGTLAKVGGGTSITFSAVKTYIYCLYCGGTPTGAGREDYAVVYKLNADTLAIEASKKVQANWTGAFLTDFTTCGQTLAVYKDYVYVYPAYNNGGGTTRNYFIRLKKLDLSYVNDGSSKYGDAGIFGLAGGTQCSKMDSEGHCWVGGGNPVTGAEIYTNNADFSTLKRYRTVNNQINMPLGMFIDLRYYFTITSGSATVGATYTNNGQVFTVLYTIASQTTLKMTGTGSPSASGTLTKVTGTGDSTITFSAVAVNNDVYYLGTMAVNNYASMSIVRFTQGTWPTITFSSGVAIGTAEATPAATYGTALANYAVSACSDTDPDYMWVSGMILNEADKANKRDGFLIYLKKRNSGDSDNLQVLNVWRFSETGGDYDFALGEVFCDGNYLYLTKIATPHNGLGVDAEVAGIHSSSVVCITKATLFTTPASAIYWARGVNNLSQTTHTYGLHAVKVGMVLYNAGLSTNKQYLNRPVCSIRKEDLTNTSTTTKYTTDASTKIFNIASTISIVSQTIGATASYDAIVVPVTSFSLDVIDPGVGNWSDYTATATNGSSLLTISSTSPFMTEYLYPTGDDDAYSGADAWSQKAGGDGSTWYSCVDEAWDSPDDATSRIYINGFNVNYRLFTHTALSSAVERIVKVEVVYRYKWGGSTASARARAMWRYTAEGSNYMPASRDTSTAGAYATFTTDITTWSGAPTIWTKSDIDNLLIGVEGVQASLFVPAVTQVYLKVTWEYYNVRSIDTYETIGLNTTLTAKGKDPAYTRWYGKRW